MLRWLWLASAPNASRNPSKRGWRRMLTAVALFLFGFTFLFFALTLLGRGSVRLENQGRSPDEELFGFLQDATGAAFREYAETRATVWPRLRKHDVGGEESEAIQLLQYLQRHYSHFPYSEELQQAGRGRDVTRTAFQEEAESQDDDADLRNWIFSTTTARRQQRRREHTIHSPQTAITCQVVLLPVFDLPTQRNSTSSSPSSNAGPPHCTSSLLTSVVDTILAAKREVAEMNGASEPASADDRAGKEGTVVLLTDRPANQISPCNRKHSPNQVVYIDLPLAAGTRGTAKDAGDKEAESQNPFHRVLSGASPPAVLVISLSQSPEDNAERISGVTTTATHLLRTRLALQAIQRVAEEWTLSDPIGVRVLLPLDLFAFPFLETPGAGNVPGNGVEDHHLKLIIGFLRTPFVATFLGWGSSSIDQSTSTGTGNESKGRPSTLVARLEELADASQLVRTIFPRQQAKRLATSKQGSHREECLDLDRLLREKDSQQRFLLLLPSKGNNSDLEGDPKLTTNNQRLFRGLASGIIDVSHLALSLNYHRLLLMQSDLLRRRNATAVEKSTIQDPGEVSEVPLLGPSLNIRRMLLLTKTILTVSKELLAWMLDYREGSISKAMAQTRWHDLQDLELEILRQFFHNDEESPDAGWPENGSPTTEPSADGRAGAQRRGQPGRASSLSTFFSLERNRVESILNGGFQNLWPSDDDYRPSSPKEPFTPTGWPSSEDNQRNDDGRPKQHAECVVVRRWRRSVIAQRRMVGEILQCLDSLNRSE